MENDIKSIDEVAELLHVTTRTIDNWISQRGFPVLRITRKKRLFSWEEITDWAKKQK